MCHKKETSVQKVVISLGVKCIHTCKLRYKNIYIKPGIYYERRKKKSKYTRNNNKHNPSKKEQIKNNT